MPIHDKTKDELIVDLHELQLRHNPLKELYDADSKDRKQADESRINSESLFRLLAENATDMISHLDMHGTYLNVSSACKALLGYEPEELVGHSAFEFSHPDSQFHIEQSLTSITDILLIEDNLGDAQLAQELSGNRLFFSIKH